MTTTELVLVLAVLILACAVPVALVGWGMLASQRRLEDHNRDLLKGLLSTTVPGGANHLAQSMEAGAQLATRDQVEARAERERLRVPREVGR